MLEQVETMFEGMQPMMKKLKKASYEERMRNFRRKHGHYFEEMTAYLDSTEEKEPAADEIATVFVTAVEGHFTQKGRIKGPLQADLNLFMIYYVFPALLLTEHSEAKLIAESLCKAWGKTFKKSNIGYTDYDTLYKSFNEKILGLF